MIKLNKTTKKALRFMYEYENSKYNSITELYARPSSRKYSIEASIKNSMRANNYIDYRVLGGNCSFFTVGYKTADSSSLIIETGYNQYIINL